MLTHLLIDETAFIGTLIESNYTDNMGSDAFCLGNGYDECDEEEYIYVTNV